MGAITHNGEVLQRLPANASQINFDKTGTNLNSTQTENAIKEVNTKVNTNANDIDQLKSGLTGKVDYVDLGMFEGTTEEALHSAYGAITIYDRPIIAQFTKTGHWMVMAYKYTGGNYGSMIAFRFNGDAYMLTVNNGVETIKGFTLT